MESRSAEKNPGRVLITTQHMVDTILESSSNGERILFRVTANKQYF